MSVSDDRRPYALVVDDDPIIRMDAAAMLEDFGFRAIEATNADRALDMLRTHQEKVTLLFTDVDMPGSSMNGFGLARAAASILPELGILVASGQQKPSPNDLPSGAVFIGKPFSADVVADRVRELLPDGKKPEALKA